MAELADFVQLCSAAMIPARNRAAADCVTVRRCYECARNILVQRRG